jgi:hypothetical protein
LTDTILFQEPGVTIAFDDQAHTLAPYGRSVRPNGDINHGFADLRDRPEMVHFIPEAQPSPGLQGVLVALNRKESRFMSLGCLRGLPCKTNSPAWPLSLKSSATMVFRNLSANESKENLITLAHDIWGNFKVGYSSARYPTTLELVVEPLKALFHLGQAFCLDLGMVGYGRSEEEAAAANDWLATEMMAVIDQLSPGAAGNGPLAGKG